MKIVFTVLFFFLLSVSKIYGADHAVVLLYHHVSEVTPASTSVSPKTFRQHLDYLSSNDFTVLPLGQVLKTLAEGRQLPEKTVSITFDDAYRSVLDQAMPMLKERNWPFTVFVNTKAIDKGYRNYLRWDGLKLLLNNGAEVGNHSHTHSHLVRLLKGETREQWRARIEDDINSAQKRLREELGVDAEMFAYPFGEHTPELQAIVDELGFYGIAQQSGALGHGFNKLAVPRFPLATNYADMKRFAISVNARPLPVTDITTGPVVQTAGVNIQSQLVFKLLPGKYREKSLACYSSSGEKLKLELDGDANRRQVKVQLPDWQAGRRKINCTAPSSDENGVYYWYSYLWLVKQPDGQWYKE